MNKLSALAAGLMMAAALGSACAQTTPPANAALQKQEIAKGDPARWYKEDKTSDARLQTLRKEIAAAFQEASIACKQGPSEERASCLKDARGTYQQDMANAKQIVKENNVQ
jgi:hypothetical protein